MLNIIGFFILLLSLCAPSAHALDVPPLAGKRLHDRAKVLSDQQNRELSGQLAEFEKTTSNQVAILIIDSLAGESIEDFSLRVAEAWKIGQKGKDNGLLITISVQDRKYRFEVGYGLEGALPDGLVGSIGRDFFRPNFRKGDYYTGLSQALGAVVQATKGEYKPEPSRKPANSFSDNVQTAIITLFIAYGLINFMGHKFLGGLIGAVEGLIFSALLWPGAVFLGVCAVIGSILGWVIAANRGTSGGMPLIYWSTGSGSRSGGDFSDFFSGGGGSFGGGGASGDW